jgi:hypothetical protein
VHSERKKGRGSILKNIASMIVKKQDFDVVLGFEGKGNGSTFHPLPSFLWL